VVRPVEPPTHGRPDPVGGDEQVGGILVPALEPGCDTVGGFGDRGQAFAGDDPHAGVGRGRARCCH
jgi:hypothetical protein